MSFLKKPFHALAGKFGYELKRIRKDGQGVNPVQDMQRFLSQESAPLIFDVGGNTGQSVSKFLQAFPTARVHSFEPSPATYAKLAAHCAQFPHVKAWNVGVGSQNATIAFHENEYPEMSSILPPSEFAWGKIIKTTQIPVVTLDAFTKEQNIEFIHLLKSDTQGYDFEVFKGANQLMRENRIAMIYFEFIFSDMYKNLPPFHEVFRYLTENNFVLVAFYESYFQQQVISWTDALFINRAHLGKINRAASVGGYTPRTYR